MTKGLVDKRNNVGAQTAIVLIASFVAQIAPKAMTAYTGAKSALIAASKCIAAEISSMKLRINTVSPADIKTPMTEKLKDKRERLEQLYPFGFGEVSDIANIVSFLLSDKAKWITGQNYILYGGGVVSIYTASCAKIRY